MAKGNTGSSNPSHHIRSRLYDIAGFVISAFAALYQGWTVQEITWSFWICGLVTCWLVVTWVPFSLFFPGRSAAHLKYALDKILDKLKQLHSPWFSLLRSQRTLRIVVGVALTGLCILPFYLYNMIFSFYALFLSFFVQMEPARYFGPNGFINSNFWDPVYYLIVQYWPMIVGTLVSQIPTFRREASINLLVKPFRTKIMRLHLVIVGMPLIIFLSWAALGDNYQFPSVIAALALFYYLPLGIDD